MSKSKIKWTELWHPLKGCDKVSKGCKFSYAEAKAKKIKGNEQSKVSENNY